MATEIVTIPRRISRGEELVVVRRKDFERFQKLQEELGDALEKVRRGRREYKMGKTVMASSPRVFR